MIHFVAFPFSLCLNYCFFFLCFFFICPEFISLSFPVSVSISVSSFAYSSVWLPVSMFFFSLSHPISKSLYIYVNKFIYLNHSINLFGCACMYVCLYMSICSMYVSLFIYINLSVSQSLSPSVSLSINQSIDLFPSHVPSAHQLTLTLTASIPYTDFRFPSNFIASPLHLLSPIPRDCRLLASLSSIIPIDNAAKESELPRRPLRHVTLIYITAGDPPQPR